MKCAEDAAASQPFLKSNDDHQLPPHRSRRHTVSAWLFCALLLLYTPLLAGYFFLYQRFTAQCSSHPELMPVMARDAGVLEYELRKYSDYATSPFAGDPRPELEAAWHDLFEHTNIRVSEEDLNGVNLTSLELADGSGYVAQPGVFHELHCIKRIRHWIYKDHYMPGISGYEYANWKGHIDHCIEMLRSATMCRGDTSLSTMHWLIEDGVPRPSAQDLGPHECVKWDPLLSWVKEREIDLFDNALLRKPEGY